MKRFKRLTSIALISALAFSMSACGSSNNDNNTATEKPAATDTATKAPDSTETPSEEAAATEEPTPEPAKIFSDLYEAKDLGGREIIFCANWDDVMGQSTDEYPKEEDGNFEDNVMRYENRKRVEEKYNITIKSINVPYAEVSAQLATTVMSGNPFADVVFTEENPLVSLIVNDFLMPAKDYMPATADALNDRLSTEPGIPILGEVYYFRTVPRKSADAPFLIVNQDIVRTLGVTDPVELYESGKWTYDAFMEICKKATKDTNGDEVIDQWGLGGTWLWIMQPLIASNGGKMFDAESGKQSMDSPKTLKAMEFLKNLYLDEKVVYVADGGIWDWGPNQNAFIDGKVAFAHAYIWMLQNQNLNYEYSTIPFPKGPDNTTDQSYLTAPKGAVIPRGVKDAQYIYQIYEELQNWYGADVERSVNEGSLSWMMDQFQTEEDFDRIMSLAEVGGSIDLGISIPGYDVGAAVGPIVDGTETVAQAIESKKEMLQAAADKMFIKSE